MAITKQIPNTMPFVNAYGMATKLAANPVPVPPEIVGEVISCNYIQQPYSETVFASDDPTEWWKNDKNEFLYKRYISGDTVDIELYKNDVKIEDLNNNDFGTYFNGFPNGSNEQQLYKGYLLDWHLVYATYGSGNYTVKAQTNILGVANEVVSRNFYLIPYSLEAAHGTVRIESVQNGNIIGNIFDFSNLQWYQSLRVKGRFGNPQPIYSTDNYVSENRVIEQNQARMNREWDLFIKPIPFEIVEKIIYNKVLANSILMTNYNIFAESEFKRVSVVLKEASKREIENSQNQIYELKFSDNKDIYIKRNY